MPSFNRVLKWLLLATLVPTLLLIIGYNVFVHFRIKQLPEIQGPTTAVFSKRVQRLFWISEFGSEPLEMKPLSFWKMVIEIAKPENRVPAHQQAASLAGKQMILKVPREGYRDIEFQLDWAFASIWISRNWTAEETVNTLLEERNFGSIHPGIDNAARWYFETDLDSLTNEEVIFLASIFRSPMTYNPWKNPDKSKKRLLYCLGNVNKTGEYPVTLDPESGLNRLSEKNRDNAPSIQ